MQPTRERSAARGRSLRTTAPSRRRTGRVGRTTPTGPGLRARKSLTVERVDVVLRHDRARNGGDGEQEQQDQRHPHRGELPPAQAENSRADSAGGRPGSGVTGAASTSRAVTAATSKPPIQPCNDDTISVHTPVTRSSPSPISMAPADPQHPDLVPAYPPERAQRPPVGEGSDHERQPEAEAVRQREQRAPRRAPVVERQRLHGRQGRAGARRPADAEQCTDQRRTRQRPPRATRASATPAPLQAANLRSTRPSAISTTPIDPGDRVGVLTQRGTQPAEERAVGDEDHREAQDEQQRAEHYPRPPAVGQLHPGEASHVRQVARHQRQHARGQERHESRQGRDRHCGEQGPREHGVGNVSPIAGRGVPGLGRSSSAAISDTRSRSEVSRDLIEHAGRHPTFAVDHQGAGDRTWAAVCRGRPAGGSRSRRRRLGR